ncbi:hypothetical protein OK016_08770 [Vibrio chagasii]|nr:hypothetical protein [Vibrio chagasii]
MSAARKNVNLWWCLVREELQFEISDERSAGDAKLIRQRGFDPGVARLNSAYSG